MLTLSAQIQDRGAIVAMPGDSKFASDLIGNHRTLFTEPDVAIIDLPYPADALIRSYRSLGVQTVVFDHLGLEKADVTVAVDSALDRTEGFTHFQGLEYAIIRSSFRRNFRNRRNQPLIAIGGADIREDTGEAASKLARLGYAPIVISGPGANIDKQRLPSAVRFLKAPRNFEKLVGESLFAVVNGGTTLLEAIYLGKGAFVLPQTAEEESFARQLLTRKLVLGVGISDLRPPSHSELTEAFVRGPEAIDGMGCERLCEVIFSLRT